MCVPASVHFLNSWHNFFYSVDSCETIASDLLTNYQFTNAMGNLLYTIAVVLIIIWLLGFLGILGTGIASSGLIHILLVIAVIAIILRLIQGRGV